ncbi:putative adsorption associated tail protein [Rhizobium phage RHph_TM39]|uniref:Putative adsorption associated tail protein n=1 Tax=Rhizobium phage RHph_TM30 TaxID=2509764 RepID=A0A7S5RG56_9CAUD|nr:putative adsorption associated tail protein [Rhizobium phage RHph_TM30]QIG71444.1 putative adsorption associated tail protein [Rhizobium phage RHph_TM30]QIG72168.1 putative adsorption associated tail protein [Rhizobium phage RHph_TM2_3B]QIG77301.1 putative adsorption associated tail protein [Rhizobium phage RHph_TM39]
MTYTPPNAYFNRFDATKNYSRLLFLAGSGLQAAELNEIQESIRNDLKLILTQLVTNGSILTGGEVEAVTTTGITLKNATVYLDGVTAQVPTRVVPITATGTYVVGVAAKTVLITELEDPLILEPDPASPNVGQPGAMREKMSARWIAQGELTGDEVFFPIITIVDGVIQTISRQTDDVSLVMNKLLNQYDRETRGSTVLYGMSASFDSFDGSNSAIVNISSGKARVNGVPVIIETQQKVLFDPVVDNRAVAGEPYTYTGSATYNLRYNKINTVTRIQGTKSVTRTITHGSFSGAIDVLPDTPVLAVSSVTQGGTTYVVNTDYIVSGDSINWSPGGAEPAPGSTYTVTYTYISTFVPTISGDGLGVVLDSSNVLVNGSVFYVDYDYFLKRIDRLSITENKQFVISRGTPGYTTYNPPQYLSNALSLFTIELINGSNPVITADTVTNIPQSELNSLKSRLFSVEDNVATLSLMDSARSTDPTTNKRNLFVDNLKSNVKQDLGLTNNMILYLESLILDSTYNRLGVTSATTTLPFTETDVISQTQVTTSQKINPYAVAGAPPIGQLQLTPSNITQTTIWYQYRTIPSATGSWKKNVWNTIRDLFSTPLTSQTKTSTITTETVQARFLGFAPGETIHITYRSISQNVTADGSGSYTYNLSVAAGTPTNNYEIKGVGLSSNTTASAVLRVMTTATTEVVYYDPIAETFVLDEDDGDLTSVSLYVTELPDDDIVTKVAEAEYGIPLSATQSESGRIKKASVVAGWNKISFESPIPVSRGDEKALVVLTSQPAGSVGIAKLGYNDMLTQKRVTQQPYGGVFQVSANESTWTAFQDSDLTMILRKAVYTSGTSTATLLTLTGLTSISDWVLSDETITVPQSTTARFYLQDQAGTQYDITPGIPLYTVPLSGTVLLKVDMISSSTNKSPIIGKGLCLYGGTPVKPGTYTSRQFDIPNGSTTPATLKLVIDQYVPTGSTFQPSVQLANSSFASMTFVSSTQIGNEWTTSVYTYTGLAANASRLRLTLDKTDFTTAPAIRNIRLTIS